MKVGENLPECLGKDLDGKETLDLLTLPTSNSYSMSYSRIYHVSVAVIYRGRTIAMSGLWLLGMP